MGKTLLEVAGIDTNRIHIEPEKPDEETLLLKSLIQPIFEEHRRRKVASGDSPEGCEPASPASTSRSNVGQSGRSSAMGSGSASPRSDTDGDDLSDISYTTMSWLESVNVKEAVEAALLEPLKEAVRHEAVR